MFIDVPWAMKVSVVTPSVRETHWAVSMSATLNTWVTAALARKVVADVACIVGMVGQVVAMVSLLPLSEGGFSLEFAPGDIDRVSAALSSRFGRPRVTKHPTLTVYSFGATELTFQNEWEDPCLVASTPEGAAMLKAVLDDLTASSV